MNSNDCKTPNCAAPLINNKVDNGPMMFKKLLTSRLAVPALCVIMSTSSLLTACGGPGSDSDDKAPIAVATALGVSATKSVRTGQEVLLTAKDSEGVDSPILRFKWDQIDNSGQTVELIERTVNSRVFTVPQVFEPTELQFRLTVYDADNDAATSVVTLNVVPSIDADRLLEHFNDLNNDYQVVAVLRSGVSTTAPVNFTITQTTAVDYADRNSPDGTANQTELLAVGNPVAINSSWSNGITSDWASNAQAAAAFYHPRVNFNIPDLDVDDINKNFENENRDRRLDEFQIDSTELHVRLAIEVDPQTASGSCIDQTGATVSCQESAQLLVIKTDGSFFELPAAPAQYDVLLNELVVVEGNSALVGFETAESAQAYYAAVDPFSQRETLNDWLTFAGFTDSSGESILTEEQFSHAVYLNNYDLGFGRDMFVRSDDQGNVYSYVMNYPGLETAYKSLNLMATVVMEYSPPDDDPSGEKFVKFFTYVPDEQGDQVRVLSFNFDGRGEKFMPGVCLACHGGKPKALDAQGAYRDGGNVDGSFLPWDLDAFLYSDALDPAQIDPDTNLSDFTAEQIRSTSRQAQESQFKAFNQAALLTYQGDVERFTNTIEMISGWYGDLEAPFDTLPNETFDGNFTPQGWQEQEALYQTVFARYCRACHSQQQTPAFRFESYDDFVSNDNVTSHVFESGLMPLARLTMDRFWVNYDGQESAASLLRQHFNDNLGLTLDSPGMPNPVIDGDAIRSAVNFTSIRFDASMSLNAAQYAWTISQAPAGSAAQINGADTAFASIEFDRSGDYTLALAVTNARGQQASVDVDVIVSPAVPVRTSNIALTLDEGGQNLISRVVLHYQDADSSADALNFSVSTLPLNGDLSLTEFTQADINAGLLTYTHDGSETLSDTFVFNLSDGSNNLAGQVQTITISPLNDAPILSIGDALVVEEGLSAALGIANLNASDADNVLADLVYTVTTAPSLGMLSASTFTQVDINNNRVTYTHGGSETDSDSFVFTLSDGEIQITGNSVEFDITRVNDIPTLTRNLGVSVMEDSSVIISNQALQISDVDTDSENLDFVITAFPSNGQLRVNGRSGVTAFSQLSVDRGVVVYAPNANFDGDDEFSFTISDGESNEAGGNFLINIVPQSDIPTLMTNITLDVNYGTAATPARTITNANLRFQDIDNSDAELVYTVPVTGRPSQGFLNMNEFTQADINNGLVVYTLPVTPVLGEDGRVNTAVSFSFDVSDGDNTVRGGVFDIALSASFSANISAGIRGACGSECHDGGEFVDGFDLTGVSGAQFNELTTEPAVTESSCDFRVNTGSPTDSCVLRKPIGQLSHGGGSPLGTNNTANVWYLLLQAWIEAGALEN